MFQVVFEVFKFLQIKPKELFHYVSSLSHRTQLTLLMSFLVLAVGYLAWSPYQTFHANWHREFCHSRIRSSWSEKLAHHWLPTGGHWIDYQPNFTALRTSVFDNVPEKEQVLSAIEDHLNEDTPQKSLILSFYGPIGVGKTYLAKHIARALYPKYRKNEQSNFVNFLLSSDFTDNSRDRDKFKATIEKAFARVNPSCGRSLFIIDGVDKLPDGFIDLLLPFIEHEPEKKAIFILISSKRLAPESSDLIQKAFVYHFIPFFPLEKRHIRQCFNDHLTTHQKFNQLSQSRKDLLVEALSNAWKYDRVTNTSIFGCKNVYHKVNEKMNLLDETSSKDSFGSLIRQIESETEKEDFQAEAPDSPEFTKKNVHFETLFPYGSNPGTVMVHFFAHFNVYELFDLFIWEFYLPLSILNFIAGLFNIFSNGKGIRIAKFTIFSFLINCFIVMQLMSNPYFGFGQGKNWRERLHSAFVFAITILQIVLLASRLTRDDSIRAIGYRKESRLSTFKKKLSTFKKKLSTFKKKW